MPPPARSGAGARQVPSGRLDRVPQAPTGVARQGCGRAGAPLDAAPCGCPLLRCDAEKPKRKPHRETRLGDEPAVSPAARRRPVAFLCESLVRCETPASDFRLLWMRKRAGAFRPQLLLVPRGNSRSPATSASSRHAAGCRPVPRSRRRGGLKGKALTKREGHMGTHGQARRCVGADQLSRSDATEAEAAPWWLDRPLLLAMAHVPEHPLVAGGGLEVA